jgi:hypothetical protein
MVADDCYVFVPPENVPTRNSDVDYRFLEAAKAGDLDTVQVCPLAEWPGTPPLLAFLHCNIL